MMESIGQLHEEIHILKDYNHIDTDELEKIADAIEREVESNYVELPKDVNDERIRIGDTLEGKHICGGWCKSFEVRAITYDKHRCLVRDEQGFEHYTQETRHKPPTVEDVLEEALNRAANLDRKEGYWPSAADITNIVNEVAPKLQIREEE